MITIFLSILSLTSVIPIHWIIIVGVVHALISIAVAYLPCPFCNKPVGRGKNTEIFFLGLWSEGGSCRACGQNLACGHWRK